MQDLDRLWVCFEFLARESCGSQSMVLRPPPPPPRLALKGLDSQGGARLSKAPGQHLNPGHRILDQKSQDDSQVRRHERNLVRVQLPVGP